MTQIVQTHDHDALLCIADNIDGFWSELALKSLDGDASIVEVARREAQHLREIAARIKGEQVMSWSTSASGKPDLVIAAVESAMTGYQCPEPEQSIKMQALEVIRSVCSAQPDGTDVAVSAYGSQSRVDSDPESKAVNSLSIIITATRT